MSFASAPVGATPPPLQTLGLLRDLGLRLTLPEALESGVVGFVRRASPPLPADPEAARALFREGLELIEEISKQLDREVRQITEEMVAASQRMSSHGSYPTQVQSDVSRALQDAKARLDEERQKFGPRFAKQQQAGLDGFKATLDAVATRSEPEEFGMRFGLAPAYRAEYERWARELFEQWGSHTAELLKDRGQRAIEPALQQLTRALGTPVALDVPPAEAVPVPSALDVGACEEHAHMPSWGESYKESLFHGLNQVAMLASLVIIPVVGNFSHEQPVTLRIVVMSAAVVPTVLIAYSAARRHRRKHFRTNSDRAMQSIQRQLNEHFRSRVERFKTEYDSAVQRYLKGIQDGLGETVQRLVTELLEQHRRRALDEQARVKVESDQLQERLSRLRQARAQLTDQIRVELTRRLQDLEAARGAAEVP